MFCPKCGSSEDIVFFVRHMKSDEEDDSSTANCLTILHASKECGYNQSMMLDEVVEVVFKDWSELAQLEEKVNNLDTSFSGLVDGLSNMFTESEIIETEGEVVEDKELPPVEEEFTKEEIDGVEVEHQYSE